MPIAKTDVILALGMAGSLIGWCSFAQHASGDGIAGAPPERTASRLEPPTTRDTIDCHKRFTIRCA